MNNTPMWVDPTYTVVALLGAALAMYVMQKTEYDRINRVDSPLVQWLRRLAFVIVGLALCYSIIDQSWTPSLPVLGLVAAGVGNLAVNAVALSRRSPPTNRIGMRYRATVSTRSRLVAVLRRISHHG